MKTRICFAALICACAGTLCAQDKVTVPLSSPSQPATVRVRLIIGNITVKAGSGPEVVVTSTSRARTGRGRENPPPGMHRLDTGDSGLSVEEDHNTVTIGSMRPDRSGDLEVLVPVNTSVQLRTISGGNIDVSGINGEIDVENMNGSILLTGISGSVMAHTLNGTITATIDKVAPDKPMAFTSLNGKIDVTLPADTKARLRLKTDNGEIYTDFDVKMGPDGAKPVVEDARGQGEKYRIRINRGVSGSINGGGPEYVFQTFNGSIYIHRR
jgi:DUF4097 and DUF4098 domain-containing protein YvlB